MVTKIEVPPHDEHNQKLVDNVHPPSWVNPKPEGKYNLVAIGAGSAGLVSSIVAANLGGKVALIERHLMGGDCLNYGCVPSKALIRAARAAAEVRDAHEYGVNVPDGVTVDFHKVMIRMRELRARIAPHDSAERFRDLGVDVFLGQGTFTGPNTIQVGDQTLHFKKAVIATGARAFALPIPGLAEAGFLTNETIFSLTELPKRLAVIGSGPIGCEMAQSFARFGSQVHLLEREGQILTREDQDAAQVVQKAMVKDGIDLIFDSKIDRVDTDGDDKVVHFTQDGAARSVRVDAILVGVGRVPNVDGLGLDAAGVKYSERHGVDVDDNLRTSNPNIFAAGDICLKYKFTHTAGETAGIVIQNALFPGPKAKVSALTVPWCTYTDPEIAHVGMYEKDAADKGIEIDTFEFPLHENDRSILESDDEGFVKVHVKKGTDKIVGGTIVAKHAGEMISELSLAIVSGTGLGGIAKTIHPYPTQAEAIRSAANAWRKTTLTPFKAKIVSKLLAWARR